MKINSYPTTSDLSHLDQKTYERSITNALMTPELWPQRAVHDPGYLMIGILKDLGWGNVK